MVFCIIDNAPLFKFNAHTGSFLSGHNSSIRPSSNANLSVNRSKFALNSAPARSGNSGLYFRGSWLRLAFSNFKLPSQGLSKRRSKSASSRRVDSPPGWSGGKSEYAFDFPRFVLTSTEYLYRYDTFSSYLNFRLGNTAKNNVAIDQSLLLRLFYQPCYNFKELNRAVHLPLHFVLLHSVGSLVISETAMFRARINSSRHLGLA